MPGLRSRNYAVDSLDVIRYCVTSVAYAELTFSCVVGVHEVLNRQPHCNDLNNCSFSASTGCGILKGKVGTVASRVPSAYRLQESPRGHMSIDVCNISNEAGGFTLAIRNLT